MKKNQYREDMIKKRQNKKRKKLRRQKHIITCISILKGISFIINSNTLVASLRTAGEL